MRYVCIYLVLSATDQAKAVRELTQHVRETNSEVSEQDVGETTRRRNDRKHFIPFDSLYVKKLSLNHRYYNYNVRDSKD